MCCFSTLAAHLCTFAPFPSSDPVLVDDTAGTVQLKSDPRLTRAQTAFVTRLRKSRVTNAVCSVKVGNAHTVPGNASRAVVNTCPALPPKSLPLNSSLAGGGGGGYVTCD